MIKVMSISEVCKLAERTAAKYNPAGLAPFPFEEIAKKHNDLRILTPAQMHDDLSGAIIFQDKIFYIFVNSNRSEKRQYFTIAHELGHYYLHKDYLRLGNQIIDQDTITNIGAAGALYRPDDTSSIDFELKNFEKEANNFAASLIMPEKLVRDAWKATDGKVDECAEIFKVSTVAMSVRLERLGLVN
jgi:Zn-dependent peptidase ImmA (M78 family)